MVATVSLMAFDVGASLQQQKEIVLSSLPEDNKDVKNYVESLERKGVNHPSEYIMLGLTYDYGIKEAGIKEDKKKAKFFYRKAIDNDIVYGNIRLAILLAEEGNIQEASAILDKAYFSQKQTIDEDKIILNIQIQLAKKNKDNPKLYYFLKEDYDKYKRASSALDLFFLKYYGAKDIEQDLNEAEYFLNQACTNKNADSNIIKFCNTSSLVQKKMMY